MNLRGFNFYEISTIQVIMANTVLTVSIKLKQTQLTPRHKILIYSQASLQSPRQT